MNANGKIEHGIVEQLIDHLRETAFKGHIIIKHNESIAKLQFESGLLLSATINNEMNPNYLQDIYDWKSGTYSIIEHQKIDEKAIKTDKAVEIAKDTYWVGYRNPDTMLQINVYLRIFQGKGKIVNMLIDPGSPVDYKEVAKKVDSVIGSISNIDIFSVNHQDPDVGTNGVKIQELNPKTICVTTEDVWRLAQHTGFDPKRVRLIHPAKDKYLSFSTGHRLKIIPTPFVHFKGAFALFDPETSIAYTGDFYCGLTSTDSYKQLYASEESWDGIASFHKLYMPSNRALVYSTAKLEELKDLKLIAPQHGTLIEEEFISDFMARMKSLKVGLDILSFDDDKEINEYQQLLNLILKNVSRDYDLHDFMKMCKMHSILKKYTSINNMAITILKDPKDTLDIIVNLLIKQSRYNYIRNAIKQIIIKVCSDKNILPLSLNWEEEDKAQSLEDSII